mmetsp:Transcript_27001/g.37976  ORF Transcript_27001/g.37976 Transcript_27001/m.37976 type:complete len:593 (+) Transcript_27001:118-1896(+)
MVRLATIQHLGKIKIAAQLPPEENTDDNSEGTNGYCDLSSIASDARAFLMLGSSAIEKAQTLISECTDQQQQQQQQQQGENNDSPAHFIPSSHVKLLSPLLPSHVQKFICIGMNYVDHCTEQNMPIPEEPMVFSKFSSSIVGPGDPLPVDVVTSKLDYEVELGVVIGRTTPRFLQEAHAMQYVGGYTVVHDVSARDWQLEKNGGQWLLGKTMDNYAPIGPVIVTADEISTDQVHNLGIRCYVSGELLQNSSTSQLVHKIPNLLAWLSQFLTLQPGDIIATGTPPGVGCFRKPEPRWLQPGDVVECQIDTIGTLTTPVVEPIYKPNSNETEQESSVSSPSTTTAPATMGGKLQGMNCIVTGGGRGIGYGIAIRLGLEGASNVTIVDVLENELLTQACQTLQQTVPWCTYHSASCDVTNAQDVQQTWETAAKQSGGTAKLDVLVQAAGIVGTTNVKCQDVDVDNFDAVMAVNVRGIFLGCKTAIPYMLPQNYGRIINIASIAGKEGNAGMLAYSSSKAAVIGLTKSVGKEYAETGITCNALAPAVIRTQMVDDMPAEQVKYMTDKIPMKRCGLIDEVRLCVFDCFRSLTSQNLC